MAKNKFFKQKREKINLTFDASDRKSFLTGFQKRKAERRLKAKELMDKELKEMKIKMRQKQKQRLNELYENQRSVPEVEHLLEPTITYELPKQLVNITTFDANHISGTLGLSLGFNKTNNNCENELQNRNNGQNSENDSNDSNDGNDGNDSDSNDKKDLPKKIIEMKKSLKKQRIETMKSNKGFKSQQKLKHKTDLSKAKQRKKELKREIKQMKTKSLIKRRNANKRKNKRQNKKYSKFGSKTTQS